MTTVFPVPVRSALYPTSTEAAAIHLIQGPFFARRVDRTRAYLTQLLLQPRERLPLLTPLTRGLTQLLSRVAGSGLSATNSSWAPASSLRDGMLAVARINYAIAGAISMLVQTNTIRLHRDLDSAMNNATIRAEMTALAGGGVITHSVVQELLLHGKGAGPLESELTVADLVVRWLNLSFGKPASSSSLTSDELMEWHCYLRLLELLIAEVERCDRVVPVVDTINQQAYGATVGANLADVAVSLVGCVQAATLEPLAHIASVATFPWFMTLPTGRELAEYQKVLKEIGKREYNNYGWPKHPEATAPYLDVNLLAPWGTGKARLLRPSVGGDDLESVLAHDKDYRVRLDPNKWPSTMITLLWSLLQETDRVATQAEEVGKLALYKGSPMAGKAVDVPLYDRSAARILHCVESATSVPIVSQWDPINMGPRRTRYFVLQGIDRWQYHTLAQLSADWAGHAAHAIVRIPGPVPPGSLEIKTGIMPIFEQERPDAPYFTNMSLETLARMWDNTPSGLEISLEHAATAVDNPVLRAYATALRFVGVLTYQSAPSAPKEVVAPFSEHIYHGAPEAYDTQLASMATWLTVVQLTKKVTLHAFKKLPQTCAVSNLFNYLSFMSDRYTRLAEPLVRWRGKPDGFEPLAGTEIVGWTAADGPVCDVVAVHSNATATSQYLEINGMHDLSPSFSAQPNSIVSLISDDVIPVLPLQAGPADPNPPAVLF
jgi:hypothetical protein